MLAQSTVAVALLASFVAAQANLTFDPSTVDLTIRNQWCEAEFNTCKILCSNDYNLNTCNATSLAYDCTCTANNSSPGLQYYENSLPSLICEQEFKICNADAVNDSNSAAAQAACAATEASQCGHLDPTNFTAPAVTTTSGASSTPTGSGAAAGNSATSSSSKAAAATMAAMRNFGTGAFAVGAGVVFGALL